ncbi:hypothetical protein G6F65_021148 [Rhizopus arrhizus]|nr:hypothetical protein G6F65_021148 [Rhizopus arrhizus]
MRRGIHDLGRQRPVVVRDSVSRRQAGGDAAGGVCRGGVVGALPDHYAQPHPDACDHGLRCAVPADPGRCGVRVRAGGDGREPPGGGLPAGSRRHDRVCLPVVPVAVLGCGAQPASDDAGGHRLRAAVAQPVQFRGAADRP